MGTTSTKTNTKTKVLVGLLLAGGLIMAFGFGWILRAQIQGVTVASVDTTTGKSTVLPDVKEALKFMGDLLGGGSATTNYTNATNATNTNNGNANGSTTPNDNEPYVPPTR